MSRNRNDNTSVTWNRISWVVYHLYSLMKPQCSESYAMGIKENHIEKENNSRSRWTPGREGGNFVIMISKAPILTVLYLRSSRTREYCYCCLFVCLAVCNAERDTQALCLLDNPSTTELKPYSKKILYFKNLKVYFICLNVLSACMYIHLMCAWHP